MDGLVLPEDPSWIAEALTNNTLVCVTDGLYNQKKAPDICTAGWVIYCSATKHHISASLIKRPDSVSSYRGELLGILIIHRFLCANTEYYNVSGTNNIVCNNKGALYTFRQKSRRVPVGAKHNDMQQVPRQIKSKMKSLHILHHVQAHQDDYKK